MNNSNKEPKRNNWKGMMKEGRYRAFRNLPVGWVLQILHSTDKSDRRFRLVLELVVLLGSFICIYLLNNRLTVVSGVSAFIVIHTLSWFLMGNFWVYMLDSFLFVKNTGLDDTLKYIQLVERAYEKSDSCNAVLIYGSFCRNMFHGRSDLDIRIVRRTDSIIGLWALFLGLYFRAYSFFKLIPADFQVVDSMEFLTNQMRDDEKPVVAYKRQGFNIANEGRPLSDVLNNPSSVLKES